MSLSQVKLSELDALTMLQGAFPGHVTPTQMAAEYAVVDSVVYRVIARLESKGLARREAVRGKVCRLFFVDQAERERKAAEAQALADSFVKPFKTNVWTPPLKGYHARMFAAADLALAGRA